VRDDWGDLCVVRDDLGDLWLVRDDRVICVYCVMIG